MQYDYYEHSQTNKMPKAANKSRDTNTAASASKQYLSFKLLASSLKVHKTSEADPGFLERGFINIQCKGGGWGVRFADFISFS